MMLLLIPAAIVLATLAFCAMVERSHDDKVDEYTRILRFMHRILGQNKTCFHYANCPQPGMKNSGTNFTEQQAQEITKRAVEVEDKLTLDRAKKAAARRTRKDARTIEKHDATVES